MRTILILSFSFALLLHTGCGRDDGRPADMPPLFPVSITVIQDGQPLEGASVVLIAQAPAVPQYGRSSGTTTAAGIARPRTHGFDGVPAGEYTVVIEKRVTEGVQQIVDAEGEVVGSVGGRIYQLVDAQFATEAASTLSISVAERRGATETFDVGAAARMFLFQHTSD